MKNASQDFFVSRRQFLQCSGLFLGAWILPVWGSASVKNMPVSPLYAMALVPPPALSDACAAVRRQWDREHSDKTFPHITLKQPFTFAEHSAEREAELLLLVHRVCAAHRALQVQLESVSSFESPAHGNVVHVQVALSPAMHALQQALTKAVFSIDGRTAAMTPEQEIEVFYPHLTLAQGLTKTAAAALLATALPAIERQTFLAKSVVVGRCRADGVWEKIADFSLVV